MKNKKLFIGIAIITYSLFGFAKNAESPTIKQTTNTVTNIGKE
ncbi:hypothetical protein ACFQPF_14150 [Fictibacillus iocasae]|uniref:Uncharacterized protein n=1 Tax=Fictibacillus iocasae TaxID=2715437 RepID=A0ABW2NTA4_9BACL